MLNADDPRVASFRDVHPGRSVTFGFSEGRGCARGKRGIIAPRARASALWAWISKPRLTGRHAVMNLLAAIAVAPVSISRPNACAMRSRTFTVGKMRGERMEHNGIVVWNDCYNSNPEAAQSMIDVLRETPAARRIAVLGEMLELGHAAEDLHRQVGELRRRSGASIC